MTQMIVGGHSILGGISAVSLVQKHNILRCFRSYGETVTCVIKSYHYSSLGRTFWTWMIHLWGTGVEQTWSLVSLPLEGQDCWPTCNPENWVLLPKRGTDGCNSRATDSGHCPLLWLIKEQQWTNHKNNNNNVPTSLNCHFWLPFPVPQAVGLNSSLSYRIRLPLNRLMVLLNKFTSEPIQRFSNETKLVTTNFDSLFSKWNVVRYQNLSHSLRLE